jgi:2-isopropylmalate synthase
MPADPGLFQVYDTTLRDGAQQEGLSLSVQDKLAIAGHLDELGVGFIEGGWPGAIPKDTEFFLRAQKELDLRNAALAAFGATRRPDVRPQSDPQVAALLAAETPVVTLVAKSHDRHVTAALRTTLAQNLSMVGDTVRYLTAQGRRVFLDAEHFFDGYADNPGYALDVVRTAADAGAEAVVLCDTNGGMLPGEIERIVAETVAATGVRLGVHCHDDSGCAVANTLAAVAAGVDHVQGTAHGYGERCGNANLFSVLGNLILKQGRQVITACQLADMSRIAEAIAGITGYPERDSAPYVGRSAFTHKAGLHASALRVDPTLYQHTDPDLVGNTMRTLISDMAGRASIVLKARELGVPLAAASKSVGRIAETVKQRECAGYSYESADASFALLLREELADGDPRWPFRIDWWRLVVQPDAASGSTASVVVVVDEERIFATGKGNGPINALDNALRHGLQETFPALRRLELVDYQVTILEGHSGSNARTRVLASFDDGQRQWRTVGVDENVVSATCTALMDAFRYAIVGSPAATTGDTVVVVQAS